MKQLAIIFSLLLTFCAVKAQRVVVKDFQLRPNDLAAREVVRQDANHKVCALIRVRVVGVKDMKFKEAVDDVKFEHGEYLVYVSPNIQKLTYSSSEQNIKGVVDLNAFGVDIDSKRVYLLQFETSNRLRSAVFMVSPATAKIIFNGKQLLADSTGVAMADLPVGTYDFTVSANGYEQQDGKVTLSEDNVSTMTYVDLEKVTRPVTINCNTDSVSLFIDGVYYGLPVNQKWIVNLTDGKHQLRMTKPRYKDTEDKFTVDGSPLSLDKEMNMRHLKTVKHTEERSHTRVNVRNCGYVLFGGDLFDKDKQDGYKFGLRLNVNFINHFWGAFAFGWGVNLGAQFMDKNYREAHNSTSTGVSESDSKKDDDVAFYADAPLQAGFSIPFGKYNRHMFSVLGGAYGKYAVNLGTDPLKDNSSSSKSSSGNDYFDYGLRGTIRLDFDQVNYSFDISNSLNDKGISFGLSVGWKFYM